LWLPGQPQGLPRQDLFKKDLFKKDLSKKDLSKKVVPIKAFRLIKTEIGSDFDIYFF
jgi:hypothetical protein